MKVSKRLKRHLHEALATVILALDLVWWQPPALAGVCLAWLLGSYVWYRREALLNVARSAAIRERIGLTEIRSLETDYTRREDFNTQAKRAAVRSPLDRHYYHGRYARVQALVAGHLGRCRCVLDLGCGFGRNTRFMQAALKRRTVGLDLDELKLYEARRNAAGSPASQPAWLCGDAARPPFRDAAFDGILCTEVLEHLVDPAAGLDACRRLLSDGGRLVLTVPSHHNLGYTANPFMAAEKTLSLCTDRVLPPYHNLHAQFEFNWRKPESGYGIHYHFTWQRLTALLAQSGFRIRWRGSFEIELFPYLLVEWLAMGDGDRIRRLVDPIETVAASLPVIGLLGQHLLILAEKQP